jgi:hypothetical protein
MPEESEMKLDAIQRALVRDLRRETTIHSFNEAKPQMPSIAGHATPMSVKAVFDDTAVHRWREKEALLRDIIAEQQQRPHRLWGTLLLAVFYPALSRLEGRVTSEHMERAELVQVVVASFLDVVSELPLDELEDRTCMFLRQMTERRVFGLLRLSEREWRTVAVTDPAELNGRERSLASTGVDYDWEQDDRCSSWPELRQSKTRPFSRSEQARLIGFLREHVEGGIEEDRLELVIATKIRGQKLSAISRQIHAGLSSEERHRAYQKMKRRHSRTLERLRETFSAFHGPRAEERWFASV